MKSPDIRSATPADLTIFYGELPKVTLRAWVVDLDGKPAGIGGLFYQADGAVGVFSIVRPELQKHKVTVMRCARFLAEKGRRAGAIAIADPKYPNSSRLLLRLGFIPAGTTKEGKAFICSS